LPSIQGQSPPSTGFVDVPGRFAIGIAVTGDVRSPGPSGPRRSEKRISERTRDAIEEAAAAGFFDNVPGSGQPLDFSFEDNPYIPEGMRSAYRMLRNAGYALPWMEDRKDIEKKRSELDRRLAAHLSHVDATVQRIPRIPAYLRPSRTSRLRDGHEEFVARFIRSVDNLNRKIDIYNLTVPVVSLQVARYDGESALKRLRSAIPDFAT
jgi:hypothetical protein